MHLSLVIPAYNEADCIASTLAKAEAYFGKQAYDAEIIVVDDGSTDATLEIVKASFPNVRALSYKPNRGKGFAVKTGMEAACGDYRVYYDADASTPIEEIERLWPRFQDGADIVIGSRSLPDSDIIIRQTWLREGMGRFFNVIARQLGLTEFPDTQCGFKGFTAEACGVVFPRQTIEGFAFDVELLYIARKHGLRIDQAPVRWVNVTKSSVGLVGAPLSMLHDVLSISANDRRRRYD